MTSLPSTRSHQRCRRDGSVLGGCAVCHAGPRNNAHALRPPHVGAPASARLHAAHASNVDCRRFSDWPLPSGLRPLTRRLAGRRSHSGVRRSSSSPSCVRVLSRQAATREFSYFIVDEGHHERHGRALHGCGGHTRFEDPARVWEVIEFCPWHRWLHGDSEDEAHQRSQGSQSDMRM